MESIDEKRNDVESFKHIENESKYIQLGLSSEDASFYEEYPPAARKKLLRKIDIRLVPFLALLYLAAQIDRANIGNAKTEGLSTDLGLTGVQYNIALSIFFVPYILLEVPSNILLTKFDRPSHYLAALQVSWGIVITLTGIVRNYGGLVATRFALGIPEAGFYPGAVYLITRWYMPHEVQTRIAIFFSASALSGAFSGLLAYALAKMDGVGGLAGWRWIFIIEGIVTVCFGVMTWFFMIDTPEHSKSWLSEDERRYLRIQSVIREGGNLREEEGHKFRWSDLFSILTDPKVYMQGWILFSTTACSYGIKFTMPTITQSMGFTSANAQLLTIPPYVAGAISAYAFGILSDRYYFKLGRAPFILLPLSLIVIGFAVVIPYAPTISNNIAPCYIGIVLVCMGIYPTNPAGSAWISANLAGPSKKSMGIAFNICFGNLGGILGSYMFLDREAPGYPVGFGIGIACATSAILSTSILATTYKAINRKREAMSESDIRSQHTSLELAKMGDKSPLFRYKL